MTALKKDQTRKINSSESFEAFDMDQIEHWINAGEPDGSVPNGAIRAIFQSARKLIAAEK